MIRNTFCRRLAAGLMLAVLPTVAAFAAAPLPTDAQIAAYGERALREAVPNPDGPAVAVLVARGDTILFQGARGKASIELGVDATPGTVFRIASVTKMFSAATLLALVDDGRAGIDDPLSKYLPDYPNAANITLAQLLNHTSGIKSYTGIPGYMETRIRADLDTAGLVAVFRDEAVDFAPGERWAYNNSGYILVGAVIEKITGKPWHVALQERVLAPLAMTDTGLDDGHAVIPRLADGYSAGEPVTRASLLSMSQPHAAGALRATVGDLLRWNRALHGGKVLKPATYTRMITPEGAAVGDHYGFGITTATLRGQTALKHTGGIHGFVSSLTWLPESGLTLVMLRNMDGAEPPALDRRIAAYALGKPYPEAVTIDVPQAQLKGLEGEYALDAGTTRTLRVVDGRLTSQRSGSRVFPVLPVAKDRFVFEGSLNYFDMQRDASGKVTALHFHPDGEGNEVWTRTGDAAPERAAMVLSEPQKQRLVGEYAGPALSFKVFLGADGALQVQVPGQPAFVLRIESADKASIAEVGANLTFSAGDPAPGVTLAQGGQTMDLARKQP